MIFSKTFNDSYIHCGQLDLPWEDVERDLQVWQQDQTFTEAVVNDDPALRDRNPELWHKQWPYRQQGYTAHNTRIWKNTNQSDKIQFPWEQDICRQLPLDKAIATLTRQDPGQILPWHQDSFYYHRVCHQEDSRPIWRFLVFMRDWQIGHMLQVNDQLLANWKRGDVVVWHPGTMHLAANVGEVPKWTCNVTGFLTV